ncbi:low temperature requirement protein A [Pseudonocardia oroxyli]|uniref:Low temperature requirement protein LtrA n=1 Tax=Pseudonocardia oroxyli TaxID=366584 RepID=A0A1G7U0E3_PSEOR|nr:low temperature requirement protein A [Pseudonocardia oroxyli]SDG40814.1 Low temperature requirement protein LtrA [Pseudonocardia oroxyli]
MAVPGLAMPWRRRMNGRDPEEEGRASTPLELLFDLCFVVAIAQAAAQLAHGIEENHAVAATGGFVMVFFAIWWAWMNFTWFASSYDTDDVPYRLLTLLQMAGVLILAAGVPAALNDYDFAMVTVGYAVMRIPMVLQWLRAAREHPEGRRTAQRYALGIAVVQVLWLLRLLLPHPFDYIGFVVLAVAEVAVPPWAERTRPTSFHPEHIAERYGLFTIIVLGEVILAATVAFQGSQASGLTPDLVLVAVGALLLMFGIWWIYFLGGDEHGFRSLRTALTWGYGHFLVFAAVAALGAGLETAVQLAEHEAHVAPVIAGFAVAVPVALYLLVIMVLRGLVWPSGTLTPLLVTLAAVLILACAFLAPVAGIGVSVLAMGIVLAAALAWFLRLRHA